MQTVSSRISTSYKATLYWSYARGYLTSIQRFRKWITRPWKYMTLPRTPLQVYWSDWITKCVKNRHHHEWKHLRYVKKEYDLLSKEEKEKAALTASKNIAVAEVIRRQVTGHHTTALSLFRKEMVPSLLPRINDRSRKNSKMLTPVFFKESAQLFGLLTPSQKGLLKDKARNRRLAVLERRRSMRDLFHREERSNETRRCSYENGYAYYYQRMMPQFFRMEKKCTPSAKANFLEQLSMIGCVREFCILTDQKRSVLDQLVSRNRETAISFMSGKKSDAIFRDSFSENKIKESENPDRVSLKIMRFRIIQTESSNEKQAISEREISQLLWPRKAEPEKINQFLHRTPLKLVRAPSLRTKIKTVPTRQVKISKTLTTSNVCENQPFHSKNEISSRTVKSILSKSPHLKKQLKIQAQHVQNGFDNYMAHLKNARSYDALLRGATMSALKLFEQQQVSRYLFQSVIGIGEQLCSAQVEAQYSLLSSSAREVLAFTADKIRRTCVFAISQIQNGLAEHHKENIKCYRHAKAYNVYRNKMGGSQVSKSYVNATYRILSAGQRSVLEAEAKKKKAMSYIYLPPEVLKKKYSPLDMPFLQNLLQDEGFSDRHEHEFLSLCSQNLLDIVEKLKPFYLNSSEIAGLKTAPDIDIEIRARVSEYSKNFIYLLRSANSYITLQQALGIQGIHLYLFQRAVNLPLESKTQSSTIEQLLDGIHELSECYNKLSEREKMTLELTANMVRQFLLAHIKQIKYRVNKVQETFQPKDSAYPDSTDATSSAVKYTNPNYLPGSQPNLKIIESVTNNDPKKTSFFSVLKKHYGDKWMCPADHNFYNMILFRYLEGGREQKENVTFKYRAALKLFVIRRLKFLNSFYKSRFLSDMHLYEKHRHISVHAFFTLCEEEKMRLQEVATTMRKISGKVLQLVAFNVKLLSRVTDEAFYITQLSGVQLFRNCFAKLLTQSKKTNRYKITKKYESTCDDAYCLLQPEQRKKLEIIALKIRDRVIQKYKTKLSSM